MDGLPTSVLFCCTSNTIRSPMAEAMLKHLLGQRIYVDSAGLRKGTLDGFALQVIDELGMDLSAHKPKRFDDLLDDSFDLVVSLSPEAQHRALEMTRTSACEVEYWPTFDPSLIEGSRDVQLAAYREVRDQLYMRIKKRFAPTGGPTV